VKLGHDSNLYDAEIRTDTEWVTKNRLNPMRKNLVQFDAIVFCSTTGELPMSEEQKNDFMSSIRDEGKGLNPEEVPDPLAPDNLLKQSGRGIFLIRAFMDEVKFRNMNPGSEVTLIKHVTGEARDGEEASK